MRPISPTAARCSSREAAPPATPPSQEERTRLGGGLALRSPYGTFVVPNISPHPRDGIGGWSDADFVHAMRAGMSPDGRHYYPAFPYTSYQRMGAADLRDLFAYLRTLPPVEGRSARPRACLSLQHPARRSASGSSRSSTAGRSRPTRRNRRNWNRGAYLVNGPAIAPSATARATVRWDRRMRSVSPAARIRTARGRSQHHPEGARKMVGQGYRRPAGDR